MEVCNKVFCCNSIRSFQARRSRPVCSRPLCEPGTRTMKIFHNGAGTVIRYCRVRGYFLELQVAFREPVLLALCCPASVCRRSTGCGSHWSMSLNLHTLKPGPRHGEKPRLLKEVALHPLSKNRVFVSGLHNFCRLPASNKGFLVLIALLLHPHPRSAGFLYEREVDFCHRWGAFKIC